MSAARERARMLVSDWMTRTPVTLAPEAPLSTAVALLREHRIRHLPVVSGGKVCGISSDRDLKLATPFPLTDPCAIHLSQVYDRPVFEVMTTEVITVGPGDSIMEAARVMRRRKISGLPVVYNDHLIGILTESDLLDAFLSIGESP